MQFGPPNAHVMEHELLSAGFPPISTCGDPGTHIGGAKAGEHGAVGTEDSGAYGKAGIGDIGKFQHVIGHIGQLAIRHE